MIEEKPDKELGTKNQFAQFECYFADIAAV